MSANDQLNHVQPLIDQVAELIRTGQHPDASPRFKPEATAQPKAKTALAELAEWLDKVESHYPATGYMRQQLATWAQAVREADEQ